MRRTVTADDVAERLQHWQGLLRLADWDLDIEVCPEDWRKSGDVKVDLEDRKAVLMVNEQPKCDNLDELVVHELVHIKLYALDQMIEYLLAAVYGRDDRDPKRSFAWGQFMRVLESTTEDLTKSLLAASGLPQGVSFGRLRPAVAEEREGQK